MVISIDPDRRWDFVVEAERATDEKGKPLIPKEDQTIFHLRGLTPSQVAEIIDSGVEQDRIGGTVKFCAAQQGVLALGYGLVGWTNLKDKNGKQIDVPKIPGERSALLPEDVRLEVGREIRFEAELTASEGN